MPPSSLPARAQVSPDLTWNMADIFPSDAAWEAERLQLEARLEALKRAGVDLTTPAPGEQTFGVLAHLVDRLESLVK